MNHILTIMSSLLILVLATGTSSSSQPESDFSGKKILWVDSYHQGYPWSDGIEQGIRKALQGSGVKLSVFRMNTKRNDAVEFGRMAGIKAKEELERIRPDLVIATDDNAQKYFVVPYVKGTSLPVVFSGVNWDASEYGYPCKNVTGMVEVDPIEGLIKQMRRESKGSRVGFLSADVETSRKIGEIINERFFNNTMKTYRVKTFVEFKQQFLRAQSEVDMLIIDNYAGISDWDNIEAESFLARNTLIPTGTMLQFLERFVVFTRGKYPEEQGEYAASTALRILAGTKPGSLPLTSNKKSKLTVNLKIAKSANIILPLSVLKTAEVIGQEIYEQTALRDVKHSDNYRGKKVVWVDSYHQGYEWSDGIEKGIREILIDRGIDLKIIRMDTKRNNSAEFGRQAGLLAEEEIVTFRPDAIIASDDNAQKYLVVPLLLKTQIPVVFCGVNWDASMYGYPTSTITGMLEVEPIMELVKLLGQYAKGERLGYLAGNVKTERKVVEIYNKKFFNGSLLTYYVKSMKEYQEKFIRIQQEVDMLILPNHAGISDWDPGEMEAFLMENSIIPTGGVFDFMAKFVMFTLAKFPEEQGNYAAQTVLRIFSGESPGKIPVVNNQRSTTTVNLKMADGAGIVIPVSTLKDVDRVIGQETFLKE